MKKENKKPGKGLYISIIILTVFFIGLLCVYLLTNGFSKPLFGEGPAATSEKTAVTGRTGASPVKSGDIGSGATHAATPPTGTSSHVTGTTSNTEPPTDIRKTTGQATHGVTETADPPVTVSETTDPPVTVSETTDPPKTTGETGPVKTGEVTERPDEGVVYKTVDDSYFKDALFIGDSMIETFIRVADLDTTAYYYRGIMINSILTKEFIKIDGKTYNLENALKINSSFKKVYLHFGTNEQGWGAPKVFITYYRRLLDLLIKYMPDAIIYVHGTFPVTKKAEESIYYDNSVAAFYREQTIELCKEYRGRNVYYVDVASLMIGDDGYMKAGISKDGVHPYDPNVKQIWLKYLREHAVDTEKSAY